MKLGIMHLFLLEQLNVCDLDYFFSLDRFFSLDWFFSLD
jgi:hypothetical protein